MDILGLIGSAGVGQYAISQQMRMEAMHRVSLIVSLDKSKAPAARMQYYIAWPHVSLVITHALDAIGMVGKVAGLL
jgi:hypothetical protein